MYLVLWMEDYYCSGRQVVATPTKVKVSPVSFIFQSDSGSILPSLQNPSRGGFYDEEIITIPTSPILK
jgi:hypothetical protein